MRALSAVRSPLTGNLFAIELTHDFNMPVPLLIACFCGARFHGAGGAALDSTADPVVDAEVAHPDESLRAVVYRMASA
jgi:hypothetical protein